jgi:hypothetical protein
VAVLLFGGTVQTFYLPVSQPYYWLIFISTLSSYSLHWFFTADTTPIISSTHFRSYRNKQLKSILLFLFLITSVCIVYFLRSYPLSIRYFIPAALATLFYTAPKIPFFQKLEGKAFGKTLYLTIIWVYVTCILPFELANQFISESAWWYIGCQFNFIYLICLLFDYRDQQKDKLNYILLNTYKHFKALVIVISLAFSVSVFFFYTTSHQVEFSLGIVIAFLFLLINITKSIKSQSDYWFYLVLDGLMCAPAIISGIFHYLLNK